MAHKKAGGSSSLGRDSIAKRLGVKVGEGEKVKPGIILIRQRGSKFHPGSNVKRGGDDTLYALKEGRVKFKRKKVKNFTGKLRQIKEISVFP